jgi:carboxymethylenebutenolidase
VSTISLETPDGAIEALHLTPSAGSGPWPGVVVIHDATGYTDDLRSIAHRVADAGYTVLAPNLYSRGGPARCIPVVMRELLQQRGRSLEDITAAREFLAAQPDCTGAVGNVGFCMGGQFALLMAPAGFGASAPFYVAPLPRHLDQVLSGACPVVASFGSRDVLGVGAPGKLRRELEKQGVPHDVKTYPGVGHSFANRIPLHPLLRIVGFGYDSDATEDAWRRVFAFFSEHLTTPQH